MTIQTDALWSLQCIGKTIQAYTMMTNRTLYDNANSVVGTIRPKTLSTKESTLRLTAYCHQNAKGSKS